MSEPTACPSCATPVPAGASFCTSCGQNLIAAPPPDPGPLEPAASPSDPIPFDPTGDVTSVTGPRYDEATAVLPPADPPPGADAPPAPSAPWAPADPGPGASPWAPGGAGTAEPPAAPAPPAWQQPAAGPTFAPPVAPPGAPAGWATTPAPPTTWPDAAAPPAAAASSARPSPLGAVAAALGGILTLVGIFTAWVGAEGSSETVKGWDLTTGDKFFKSNDPYLLLGLGIVALGLAVLFFAGRFRTPVRIAAVVVGLAVIGICARDWMDIADLVESDARFDGANISAEFGFYLTIAGGALAVIAGLLPAKKPT